MTSLINFEQLLAAKLPLSFDFRGQRFFTDLCSFMRFGDIDVDSGVSFALSKGAGVGEPLRWHFEGKLSPSFLNRRDLMAVQWDHGERFVWRYRGEKSVVLPDLAWLCEALADGYAGGQA
ncbi:hypothetical protein QN386_06955 [Pseudomonas sp. CCI3.2]|uniref:hypothetical protein n=1 Tax=unclassified Pseudomonas TaxID=196821 RepID=UPI002B2363C6|nr:MULTISPECIES: hypothetical protein [unclassified Pseudomonas]MEB0076296.1 hypothetical protein [Pseudomonas sp. MH10out]MEB0101065.1 hypothetical protein [Pseudomonas sp. CCI3.2]MEB0128924.1 hypothetical protein [Pseudomonas sp. CCI2.4]